MLPLQLSLFKKYPKGFLSIFFTQIFFNFGFFGLKSLFVLYIIERFSFKSSEAFEIFSIFMALSYGTSLLGGFLADKFLGAKNALVIGGIFSVMGVCLFVLPSQDIAFAGLALLGLGSGCFKPTFSTLLSQLFKNSFDPLKDAAFTNLYIAMNIGSFTGPILCSILNRYYGWSGGLITVALSFLIGTYLFFKHTQHLKDDAISFPLRAGIILVLSPIIVYGLFKYRTYFHGLMGSTVIISFCCFCILFYKSSYEERAGLLKTIPYIFLFAFFCSLFEQAGGSLILFFDQAVNRQIMGFTVPSSTLLSLNPVFILLLGMLMPSLLKYCLERKGPLDGLSKFAIGFLFVSISFSLLAFASNQAQGPIAIYWILIALFLQAIGELFIVPVGFANISKLAPQRYLSLMISLWLMAISYGHYFAGILAKFLLNPAHNEIRHELQSYSEFFFKLSIMPLGVASILFFNALRREKKPRGKNKIL